MSLDSIDQIKYVEYKDSVIWKIFKWSLTANENKFNIDIDFSQKWFHIYLYNVSEFDEDVQEFEDREIEFDINLEKNKKSEYSISIRSSKSRQKTLDIVWKLSYDESLIFSANFILEPHEIIAGQKISWKIDGEIRKIDSLNKEIPQISWETLSISKISETLN